MPWKRPLNFIGGCSTLILLHLATLLSTGKQIRAFSPQKLEALILWTYPHYYQFRLTGRNVTLERRTLADTVLVPR
jgi:hypothetical protein